MQGHSGRAVKMIAMLGCLAWLTVASPASAGPGDVVASAFSAGDGSSMADVPPGGADAEVVAFVAVLSVGALATMTLAGRNQTEARRREDDPDPAS